MRSPDPQATVLLTNWQTAWTSLVAMVAQLLALVWYLQTAKRVVAGGRKWSPFRAVPFVAGILIVAYAFEGGVAHYQRSDFTAHVVQLLLLVDVAPALLAIGAPVRLALGAPGRANDFASRFVRSRRARALAHPAVGFAAVTASMYVYFLTPLYALSERHPVLLAYAHLQFLVVGCILWWIVVGRDALPRTAGFGTRFVLVFLLVPFDALLGLIVANVTKPLYPAGNTLADTQAGGNVLWGLAEVFIVAALALLFVEWAREEERKAVRADRQLDAALAVARSGPVHGDMARDGGVSPPSEGSTRV